MEDKEKIKMLEKENEILYEAIEYCNMWKCPKCGYYSIPDYVCHNCGYDKTNID